MNGAISAESLIRGTEQTDPDSDENEWQDDDSDLDQDESYYVPRVPFAQQLTALDPSLYYGSGEDFSTEENFDQTSAYINHQLSMQGFASNLQFLGADKADASRIVTTLYKILQLHLKDTEYKEEMDLNWRRLSSDHDITLQNLRTTKAQLEKSERETDILGGRIAALEEELRAEAEKHRYTREELKSAKANLQYTKTQYAHESRKKEQEMNILKDKLQKSINKTIGSSPSIPGGIKIVNPVPRSLYGKQQVKETEQLLKEVIEQQQAKEAEIVDENEQLRRTLYTVHVELEGLIRKHSILSNPTTTPYGLPYGMVKDRIETEIRDTLTLLSDQWTHRPSMDPVISPSEVVIRDQRIEDLQKEIEKMQLELEDSTLLVQGAQKMIDNLTGGNFLAGLQGLKLNVEGSDMTLQEIDEAEAKIRKQREDLAVERKKFTKACLDLGKQRKELEQAKSDFEESKRTFRLDKVMSFLSFSPRSEKRGMDHTPPSSPTQRNGSPSKKRVATSPLPSSALTGRSVRPKMKTTLIEVSDEDLDNEEQVHQSRPSSRAKVVYEHQEEEQEEALLRTLSRQQTNYMPLFDPSELARSNHEATRQRLGSNSSPGASFSFSSSTATATGNSRSSNQASAQRNAASTAPSPTRQRTVLDFTLNSRSEAIIPTLSAISDDTASKTTARTGAENSNTPTSTVTSVPLLSAVKVPPGLSKAAAHLAARKSTNTRYPPSSTASAGTTPSGNRNGSSTASKAIAAASTQALSSLFSSTTVQSPRLSRTPAPTTAGFMRTTVATRTAAAAEGSAVDKTRQRAATPMSSRSSSSPLFSRKLKF